jgi:large subunit ribosomal protein L29
MKIDEIKAMSDAEMRAKIQDMKHESLNLRIQQQSGQLERPSRLREIRRTIARIQTVLNQRQAAKNKEAVEA